MTISLSVQFKTCPTAVSILPPAQLFGSIQSYKKVSPFYDIYQYYKFLPCRRNNFTKVLRHQMQHSLNWKEEVKDEDRELKQTIFTSNNRLKKMNSTLGHLLSTLVKDQLYQVISNMGYLTSYFDTGVCVCVFVYQPISQDCIF